MNPENVMLNPGYNGGQSPASLITHEVGFHNMMGRKHTFTSPKDYPESGLESNGEDVYPMKQQTETVINRGLKNGNLDIIKNEP